jgi:hypothetical protein
VDSTLKRSYKALMMFDSMLRRDVEPDGQQFRQFFKLVQCHMESANQAQKVEDHVVTI